MNIIDKTDEEILAIAHPMWDDVEMGKQFARSELTKGLEKGADYLGMIRRGEHVTVLYRQTNNGKLNSDKKGEYLGRLVLGYEDDVVKIFGATIF